MNVRGAAIATLISRIIELTVSVIISYRPGYIHPYIGRLFKRNKQLAQDFRKCALPLLGACLFWGIGFTSYSSFMGHLGTDAAAANSVAAVVRDIICCFSAGISSAAGIMFGVIAFYMIGRSINDVTINGIFGAGGDTMFDMYSLAVCMWCLAIPLAAIGTYVLHWPVVVVYACTCIDEVGKIPWVLLHFRKYKWVKDLTH